MNVFVECHSIQKIFSTGSTAITALKNVSLSIREGEFVCIGGRSGSGKTTLLNCMGLIDFPTQGKIFVNQVLASTLSEKEIFLMRRSFLGFIFQQSLLFPYLSAVDNVALPLVYRGTPWKEARKKAMLLLEELGLVKVSKTSVKWLSGGEAQRIAVARALIFHPKLLLADEPTGELDTSNSQRVIDLLVTQKNKGVTLVMASHDAIVQKKCDRLVQLEDGQVVAR